MDVVYYSDSKKMILKIERGSPRGRECSAVGRDNPPGGFMQTQKTYKNTAKINKNRSGGLCKTQKTYKNLAKTNKNWSGGRLGVIWGVYVKLKKHTKTCVQLI